MPTECENCKANPVDILTELQASHDGLTALAQLVAIYVASGTAGAAEIASKTGYSERAVRKAKAELGCRNSGAAEPGCRNPGAESGTPVPHAEPQLRNWGSEPSRTHATKESPTEISSSKIQQQQQQPRVEEIHEAVVAAAGDALNPISIGLHVVSDVIGWMNAGADLRLDIVPTIENLSRGKRHSVNSWRFYANAVSAAKAARERGLPPAVIPSQNVVNFRPATDTSGRPLPSIAEVMAQIRAEAAHAAG